MTQDELSRGFTLNASLDRSYSGGGFAVAVPGAERRLAINEVDERAVAAFRDEHADRLAADPRLYVGGWPGGDGFFYLDLSLVVNNLSEALRLGREWGQLAVFDFDKMESVEVTT